MRTLYPHAIRINSKYLLTTFPILMLLACNFQGDSFSEREARISTRESELVTLLAELVEQRKLMEKSQSDKLLDPDTKKNTEPEKDNSCECDIPATAIPKIESSNINETRTILGGQEYVYLDPPGIEFSARIDTGAQTSSLNAKEIIEFERDGKPFVRFNILHPQTGEKIELTRRLRRHVRVKERGNRESQRRPIIKMRVVLANIDEQIDFTLVDRGRLKHQILIGRNLLRDLAIVDVSKKFTTFKNDNSEANSIK